MSKILKSSQNKKRAPQMSFCNILIKGSFQRGCDQIGSKIGINPKKGRCLKCPRSLSQARKKEDATKDVQLALTIELAK